MREEAMDVAVVHDRLCNRGGGEKVAITIAEALDADVYVGNYVPEKTFELKNRVTRTNPMRDREWEQYYVLVRMLDACSFAQLDELKKYDLVWMSGMWAPFAARNNPKNILYCHSPNRAIYDLADSLRERQGPLWRPLFDIWRWLWKKMDKRAVKSVNKIVCNSENVKGRIRKFWNRGADVIYPPVDTSKFYNKSATDYWLSVNRMMVEKRVDLQLDVFEELPDEKLIICGSAEYGTAYQKKMEGRIDGMDNVTWAHGVSDEKLYELYARCKGTIQTALDEDFGYIPPESMAAGKPCLAVNEGGFRESIVDGRTGVLVNKPYVENFVSVIRRFDPSNYNPHKLQRYAKRFSKERFEQQILGLSEEMVA